MVERFVCNEKVIGSVPVTSTIYLRVAKVVNAPDVNSLGYCRFESCPLNNLEEWLSGLKRRTANPVNDE